MRTVTVERVYLEMREPPAGRRSGEGEPAGPLRLERVDPCPVPLFRRLYREVGEAYHWRDRDAWSDDQLARHLARPDVEVHVLWEDDAPAGFFELVRHADDGGTEIAYFGLAPRFVGRGLGKRLLSAAVDAAWQGGATRVWLHTCSLDAPAALPNYLARGFREYRRETYEAELPD
ncbi:MAG TPA: GNAT family N-acetyltransferase [Gemmatimonadaceae bacterium]